MKNTLFTAIMLLIFVACAPETTTSDPNAAIEQQYLEKGTQYFIAKLDEDHSNGNDSVLDFDNIKVDSVTVFSSQSLAVLNLEDLITEYELEIDHYKKLKEIDSLFGNERSPETLASLNKAAELMEELEKEEALASAKSDKDTLGFVVHYSMDISLSDGSMIKGQHMILRFDKDGDITHHWN